jgi:hypothetical protein
MREIRSRSRGRRRGLHSNVSGAASCHEHVLCEGVAQSIPRSKLVAPAPLRSLNRGAESSHESERPLSAATPRHRDTRQILSGSGVETQHPSGLDPDPKRELPGKSGTAPFSRGAATSCAAACDDALRTAEPRRPDPAALVRERLP